MLNLDFWHLLLVPRVSFSVVIVEIKEVNFIFGRNDCRVQAYHVQKGSKIWQKMNLFEKI